MVGCLETCHAPNFLCQYTMDNGIYQVSLLLEPCGLLLENVGGKKYQKCQK